MFSKKKILPKLVLADGSRKAGAYSVKKTERPGMKYSEASSPAVETGKPKEGSNCGPSHLKN